MRALMMMAHDSSQTPSARLEETTLEAVRAALATYVSSGSAPGLQPALVRVAAEAREKAILPEHLLIVLKDLWSALPEVRAIADPAMQVRQLQRVVTMCITEYYSA